MVELIGGRGDGLPTQIGPYRVLALLGEGGMGSVYLAEDPALPRRVAVKVVKLGMDSKEVLARFEQERETLARMEHSGIAKMLDAGVSERGQPFFVMEYVAGLPLVRYCDERRLGIRDRLAMFCQVCEAVQHAHQKGVIHRDLKPGNILVKEEGDRPVPKIIDFGLARAIDPQGTRRTLFTEQGRILGTPEYMSPEQAGSAPHDLDTRTDIYSLGVILYELLVGELPFPASELHAAGVLEMQRIIREVDPPAPSSRVQRRSAHTNAAAHARATTADRLFRAIARDLDWITRKAIEKDRRRRYATAQGLVEDLQRFLRDEVVMAGPPSAWYRLRKWLRRRRTEVLVAGVIVVAGLISMFSWVQRLEADLLTESELAMTGDHLRLDALLDRANQLPRGLPSDRDPTRAWLHSADQLIAGRAAHESRLERLLVTPARDDAVRAERDYLERLARLTAEDGARAAIAEGLVLIDHVEHAMAAAAPAWATVRREIAEDPRFPGCDLPVLPGFVPLGRDPVSNLQEFAYASTGDLPVRAATGGLTMPEGMALVFVLVPGGKGLVGAVEDDPLAISEEKPQHEVQLEPYLLAKFELTEWQWGAMANADQLPSGITHDTWVWYQNRAHGKDAAWAEIGRQGLARLPVEQVSWQECASLLARYHLRLPSEAEWEAACRAGSADVWWFGGETAGLVRHANLADRSGQALDLWFARYNSNVEWDDGFPLVAPVGDFTPNPYGLHDMIGNVAEWCAGQLGPYREDVRFKVWECSRVHRGAGFRSDHVAARTTARVASLMTNRMLDVGVRPACSIPF